MLALLLGLLPASALPSVSDAGLEVGVASVDITPPPGIPLFGYSRAGQGRAAGWWTRLEGRVLLFESISESAATRERLAVLQVDLGAASDLLRQRVATRLVEMPPQLLAPQWRIDEASILLLASHTHAGPGGYFGAALYNRMGASESGYDPALVDWLAERLAAGIVRASEDLQPARLGFGRIEAASLVRNRSEPAFRSNFADSGDSEESASLEVLRIDGELADGSFEPKAAMVMLPMHATVVSKENDLYHGDVFGVAARLLRSRLGDVGHADVLMALVAAPSGDLSPAVSGRGRDEVLELAGEVAELALGAFERAGDHPIGNRMSVRYGEFETLAGKVGEAELCPTARAGVALVGGAEDGRSSWFGRFGIREGNPLTRPRGCHSWKRLAFPPLQPIVLRRSSFPARMPIHQVSFGTGSAAQPDLVLATVPGEPTVTAGRRLARELRLQDQATHVSVLAHANAYLSYVTTPEEYRAQHYEGASTLLGPATSRYLELAHLELAAGREPRLASRFRPGAAKRLLTEAECAASENEPVVVQGQSEEPDSRRTFEWHSPCLDFALKVECQEEGSGWAMVADQAGVELEVRLLNRRKGLWRADWYPSATSGRERNANCRLRVFPTSVSLYPNGLMLGSSMTKEKP